MQFGKSILKGVKWTSISTVGVALASLVRISILTRFLNKEDFGLMASCSICFRSTKSFYRHGPYFGNFS